MNQNKFSLKPYFTYLGICIFYFLAVGFVVLFFEKGQPELYLNRHWNPFFDVFFKYYTNFGDGWFYTFFNIALLFVGFYETLIALISILITTAVIQYLKLSVFHQAPRPKGYLPKEWLIHYVDGVNVHLTNSFPSGHTSTAMCMGMILAFLVLKYIPSNRNIWLAFVFFFCFLVGISRVYLMQHFFGDTLAGTFLGTFIALLVIILFENYTSLKNHPFWSRSLLRSNQ